MRNPKKLLKKVLFAVFLNYFSYIKWPFLKKSKLFGHDHLFFSPGLIGRRKIILIEDGITNYFPPQQSGSFLFLRKFLCGPLAAYKWFGNHQYCDEMILTGIRRGGCEWKNKKIHWINIYKIWENSSLYKHEKILSLFSVSMDEIKLLQGKDIVMLTQTFSEDKIMTEYEKIEMYREIVKNLDKNKLVIKTHPREKTDYAISFPDIYVFPKKVPMQLLDMLGIRFKIVYSISSSALFTFSYELEKRCLGFGIHSKLVEYGKTRDSNILLQSKQH
jgi:hypothetical protein